MKRDVPRCRCCVCILLFMGLMFVFASLFYSESFEVECPKFHIIKIHIIRNLFRFQTKGLGALVALRMVTKMAFNFMPTVLSLLWDIFLFISNMPRGCHYTNFDMTFKGMHVMWWSLKITVMIGHVNKGVARHIINNGYCFLLSNYCS